MNEFLMQNDFTSLESSHSQMQTDETLTSGGFDNDFLSNHSFTAHSACDLTAALLEHTHRPRDLNLSFQGDIAHRETGLHVVLSAPTSFSDLKAHMRESKVYPQPGHVTPPFSGGSTPNSLSRAASPTWSDGSSSASTTQIPHASQLNNQIPRHKRPSHKRAEIKRRDKIKVFVYILSLK